MAYLRDEKESFEIDYSVEEIWVAIPKAVENLEWTIQEKDDDKHRAKIKSKSGFMSYSTTLFVEVEAVDDKKSKMKLNAETPVTTITSIADFGRTRDRIEVFVETLAKVIGAKKSSDLDSQKSNILT